MLQEQHAENLHQFQEVKVVHNALVQQVSQAVVPMYSKALRNHITHALNIPLNQILQHLIDVYGTLTPREFQAKQDELANFLCNISQLYVINLFCKNNMDHPQEKKNKIQIEVEKIINNACVNHTYQA